LGAQEGDLSSIQGLSAPPLAVEDAKREGREEGDAALYLAGAARVDAVELWAQVLEELRMQMTRATFDTWLRGSKVVGVRDDALVVRVRDGYAVDWLRGRWLAPIERTLGGVVGQPVAVHFEV
jgi:hypothetical protein